MSAELSVKISLEGFEAGGDGLGGREFGSDGVGGFEAVAGNADDGGFAGGDAAFADEFLGDADGDAAGGFGEDALRLGDALDGGDDFRVGNIVGPAAAFADQFGGIVAVSGIADRKGTRDGGGLLRRV
jgi:hypothetical protein